MEIAPQQIEQLDERTLLIKWKDGYKSALDVVNLRYSCTCAECKDEWSGEDRLVPGSIPDTVRPVAIKSVGNYGIQISWTDGHSTGIYTFENLRSL